MKKNLLTIRQYLFLQWLYTRRNGNNYCDISNTDIQCFNCLDHNKDCQKGLIPASFFSKKVGRQYYDCKRVLDSLKKRHLIEELHYSGKIFHEGHLARMWLQLSQDKIQIFNKLNRISLFGWIDRKIKWSRGFRRLLICSKNMMRSTKPLAPPWVLMRWIIWFSVRGRSRRN